MNDNRDNAAIRFNFVSELYEKGVECGKQEVLTILGKEYAQMHINGDLHIHDLEGFGKIYNCCAPRIGEWLRDQKDIRNAVDSQWTIIETFESIKMLIIRIAVSQTGGIGFSNFDLDLAKVLSDAGVEYTDETALCFNESMRGFIQWINRNYTRYSREPYYITLNIGLDTTEWGREVSRSLLNSYMHSAGEYTRPNIVFKVCEAINGKGKINYDLFMLALNCTAKRMIPTYLLMDSYPNKSCKPIDIAIMGCRTRVYDNSNGQKGAEGRGNISCVSINLPRIALKSSGFSEFLKNLDAIIESAKHILIKRADRMLEEGNRYLRFVIENHIWNAHSLQELIMQGTLSIGFIGLSECIEIMTQSRPYESEESQRQAVFVVDYMRKRIDDYRQETGLNFSLLASPGEMIAGRFCSLDSVYYPHKVQEKGFYTNSFHVNVDSGIMLYDKLRLEAPYHTLCNGGCITYIEFDGSPQGNSLALEDCIKLAVREGISYLGINFPYDICKKCGKTGTFDICPECNSDEIRRTRRVSGYLEDVDFFTAGKTAEVNIRRANWKEPGL